MIVPIEPTKQWTCDSFCPTPSKVPLDECHLDLVNLRRIDPRLVIFWRMLLPVFGHGRWYREIPST
jgi:hypothetical protein